MNELNMIICLGELMFFFNSLLLDRDPTTEPIEPIFDRKMDNILP